MRQILRADFEQIHLLPPSVEDWVSADHPARFVREFVEALDLRELGLDQMNREQGGVSYEPSLLLSVWLYGYMRRVRSTRALERACREEMGFVWLSGNHRPDHNALWRFWNAHREGVRKLFTQSVKVAVDLQLVGMVVQALDGTKITAACSGRGGFDQAHLEKLLARLDAQIDQREAEIARAGEQHSSALPKPLQHQRRLRDSVKAALQRVRAGEAKHVHPGDPQAARMSCDGRNRFAYNAQAMVDTQKQVIVAEEVSNAPADHGLLQPMVAKAATVREQVGSEQTPAIIADGGYASGEQLQAVAQTGHDVLTPLPSAMSPQRDHPYHASHFHYDAQTKTVTCPQGRQLPLQRMRTRRGHPVEVYRSAAVCKDCPVRAQCTTDRHGRTIDIGPGHAQLVALRKRWQRPGTTEYYGLRAPTVEPVFAQIKQQMGFRRWTVRGLTKVQTQWSILCTTWNLQKIYQQWRKDRGENGPKTTNPDRGPRPTGPYPQNRPQLHPNTAIGLHMLRRQLLRIAPATTAVIPAQLPSA